MQKSFAVKNSEKLQQKIPSLCFLRVTWGKDACETNKLLLVIISWFPGILYNEASQ